VQPPRVADLDAFLGQGLERGEIGDAQVGLLRHPVDQPDGELARADAGERGGEEALHRLGLDPGRGDVERAPGAGDERERLALHPVLRYVPRGHRGGPALPVLRVMDGGLVSYAPSFAARRALRRPDVPQHESAATLLGLVQTVKYAARTPPSPPLRGSAPRDPRQRGRCPYDAARIGRRPISSTPSGCGTP